MRDHRGGEVDMWGVLICGEEAEIWVEGCGEDGVVDAVECRWDAGW